MERHDYVVIKATVSKYDNLFDFHEDMGMVLYNYKYGFINKEGAEIVPTIYEDAKNFSGDYAAVKKNNKWFFINKKGEKVSLDYDFVYSFKDGYAIVKVNDRWGIINQNFEEVIPTIYDSMQYPSDDLVLVSKCGVIKYINLNNEDVITLPNTVKRGYSFKNGVARIENMDHKTGYIDTKGNQITDFIYQAGSDLEGNLAIVSSKDGETIIYKNGKELFPRTRDLNISNALPNGNFEVSLGYRKYALINHLGAIITKKIYSSMYYLNDDLIRVQDGDFKYGFIDKDGNEIIPTVLDFADDFSCGLTVVRDATTKKYGYMNRYGMLVIPYIYDSARNYSNDMAIVELNGNIFYIDKNNNVLNVSETKKKLIKVEAPGSIPMYVQDYEASKDFIGYQTEISVSNQWKPQVIVTRDIDKALEHEEKVLKKEEELESSIQELTKPKTLIK